MYQKCLVAGFHPDPQGSLQRSPDPLAGREETRELEVRKTGGDRGGELERRGETEEAVKANAKGEAE